ALGRLIQAADQGAANVDQGRLLVSATNGQCRVIKTDLDRRLSDSKLRELEAKDITDQVNGLSASPDRNSLAAMLRSAVRLLENGEGSGNGASAGSPSALGTNVNTQKTAA